MTDYFLYHPIAFATCRLVGFYLTATYIVGVGAILTVSAVRKAHKEAQTGKCLTRAALWLDLSCIALILDFYRFFVIEFGQYNNINWWADCLLIGLTITAQMMALRNYSIYRTAFHNLT